MGKEGENPAKPVNSARPIFEHAQLLVMIMMVMMTITMMVMMLIALIEDG